METDIGWIIASFSLAQVIFSPLNSKIKNKIGAKNTMLCGLMLVMGSTASLGAIAHIHDGHKFKYIAIALRFIQGAGDIML